MKTILLLLIMLSLDSNACSCWDLNMDGKPYVVFKVVSGDSILQSPNKIPKHGDAKFLKTVVEVVESDTPKRKIGDRFLINQRTGGCTQSFSPPYHYILYSDTGSKEESANICSIKFKGYEGMEKAREKWFRDILERKESISEK